MKLTTNKLKKINPNNNNEIDRIDSYIFTVYKRIDTELANNNRTYLHASTLKVFLHNLTDVLEPIYKVFDDQINGLCMKYGRNLRYCIGIDMGLNYGINGPHEQLTVKLVTNMCVENFKFDGYGQCMCTNVDCSKGHCRTLLSIGHVFEECDGDFEVTSFVDDRTHTLQPSNTTSSNDHACRDDDRRDNRRDDRHDNRHNDRRRDGSRDGSRDRRRGASYDRHDNSRDCRDARDRRHSDTYDRDDRREHGNHRHARDEYMRPIYINPYEYMFGIPPPHGCYPHIIPEYAFQYPTFSSPPPSQHPHQQHPHQQHIHHQNYQYCHRPSNSHMYQPN